MSNLIPNTEILVTKVNQYLTRRTCHVTTLTCPEEVVDAVMTDLCQILEGINTQRYATGVKFFWPNLSRPGTSIVAHLRISSKDTKFQSTSYHIWTVKVRKAEILEEGEVSDDEPSANLSD